MGEVVQLFPKLEQCEVPADNEWNRTREGGPPIGKPAYMCSTCKDFAFYVTPSDIRCYYCHEAVTFK
jgi:hypothetical protein